MISARPLSRLPTLTFTVASAVGAGAGFFSAATAVAGRTRMPATASSDERRRGTGEILLSRQGDRVVQHVQQHPRHDRAGLLVEQAKDEAEGDQRRHRADAGEGVEEAEDRAGGERRRDPRQTLSQAAEEQAAEAD